MNKTLIPVGKVRTFVDYYGVEWKFQFVSDGKYYGVAHENGTVYIPVVHIELEFIPKYELFLVRECENPRSWGAYHLDGTKRCSINYTKKQLLDKIQKGY